jgi:hypothetical protein
MKRKEIPQQKKRIGELTLKEFYSLSTEDYNSYILELYEVPIDQRSAVDTHILKYHNLKPNLVLEEFFIDF